MRKWYSRGKIRYNQYAKKCHNRILIVSLQIPIELDYSTTEDTVGFLYNLIQESAVDYYNKEANVIEENKKDGMSSMEWNSERGTTVIGYIKAPEGSTLPDYTLMIACTAPAYSDS